MSCISGLRYCDDHHVINGEDFGKRYLGMFLSEIASYNNDSFVFLLTMGCGGKGQL